MIDRRSLLMLLAAGALSLLAGFSVLRAAEEEKKPQPAFRTPTAEERKAAATAIEAQLKAFRADDYKKAMEYQSADLRKNFESVEQFRQMMRKGYPQFANYKSVSFGEARCDTKGGVLEIKVTITGQDGITQRGVYVMVREEGAYRVGSVFVAPKPAPQDQV